MRSCIHFSGFFFNTMPILLGAKFEYFMPSLFQLGRLNTHLLLSDCVTGFFPTRTCLKYIFQSRYKASRTGCFVHRMFPALFIYSDFKKEEFGNVSLTFLFIIYCSGLYAALTQPASKWHTFQFSKQFFLKIVKILHPI